MKIVKEGKEMHKQIKREMISYFDMNGCRGHCSLRNHNSRKNQWQMAMAGASIGLKWQTLQEGLCRLHAEVVCLSRVSCIGSRDWMACASFSTCTNLHKTYQIGWDGMCQFFSMRKSTQNIPEVTKKKADGRWEQNTNHKKLIHPPNMSRNNNQHQWCINFNQTHLNTCKASDKKGEKKDNDVTGGL